MPYIDSFKVGNVAYDIRDKYAGLYTAGAYSNSTTYAIGDLVTRDGKLYECNTPILTAEEWTPAHWTETTLAAETAALKAAITQNIDGVSSLNITSTIGSNGVITDSNQDDKIYYAPIVKDLKYSITANDRSAQFVYAFYESVPERGSTSYNGERYVSNDGSFTAPINGYVAFRSSATQTNENVHTLSAMDAIARQIAQIIAPILPSMTTNKALTANDICIVNNTLYKITSPIAAAGTLTPGTNCEETTIAKILKTLLN